MECMYTFVVYLFMCLLMKLNLTYYGKLISCFPIKEKEHLFESLFSSQNE